MKDPKIIIEQFGSLGQFLDTISAREVNKVFSCRKNCLGSNNPDYNFSLTHSYDEATSLARTGYKEGLDKLKAIDSKTRYIGKAPKAMPITSPIGFTPHVPNAIAGVPNSMISTHKVEQKAKVISLLYSLVDSGSADAKTFVKPGKNMLNLIYTLELKGYRVALNMLVEFIGERERAFGIIQIKNWRQPSNPLKIAYPLIHPSFLRRHDFRWLETQPNLTDDYFARGYGRPLHVTEGHCTADRRVYLRKIGVLQDNWFYTEKIEAEKYGPKELIEKMGINKPQTEKPKKKPKYKASARYETKRGMGLDFDRFATPKITEDEDLPEFSAEDLKW